MIFAVITLGPRILSRRESIVAASSRTRTNHPPGRLGTRPGADQSLGRNRRSAARPTGEFKGELKLRKGWPARRELSHRRVVEKIGGGGGARGSRTKFQEKPSTEYAGAKGRGNVSKRRQAARGLRGFKAKRGVGSFTVRSPKKGRGGNSLYGRGAY